MALQRRAASAYLQRQGPWSRNTTLLRPSRWRLFCPGRFDYNVVPGRFQLLPMHQQQVRIAEKREMR